MSGFRVNSAGRVQQGHFSKVPMSLGAPRSSFDRSFSHKTTVDAGLIYPVLWEPILPGDTVNLAMNVIARLATPIFPYMDNVYMDIHYFFCPNRLVMSNWEKLQGAQDDPDDTTDYDVPALSATTHSAGTAINSIYTYLMGVVLPAGMLQSDMPIALPLRAYYRIWNEWYRNQNWQDSLVYPLTDAADTTAYALQRRNRRMDYFTSLLPSPQKGDAVDIPLTGAVPIVTNGLNPKLNVTGAAANSGWYNASSAPNHMVVNGGGGDGPITFGNETGLEGDLDNVSAVTINALRESIVLQQMLELDARGGTRYVEILLSRFGVVSPDFRLQRTEYLGGQTLDVNVSPIAQSSATDSETPQGNLAGFAAARGRASISHSFVEHGQLLGLISFRADTTYQEGLSRHLSVRTRFDYYEPLAANLGEQATLNKEIYLPAPNGSTATDKNGVLGYGERWAEYRYKPSYVTGEFLSAAASTLDSWHLALDFSSLPTIEDLLPENPPIDRIIAIPSEPQFILDMWTKFRHVRVMPIYSTPGLTRL